MMPTEFESNPEPTPMQTDLETRARELVKRIRAIRPEYHTEDLDFVLGRDEAAALIVALVRDPGDRAKGVLDHIRKELREIEADPADLSEWIDVAILAFDGAWRSGAAPEEIVAVLVAKQTRNEARQWPAGQIVASIIKPPLEAGGTMQDVLILLESVVVGVVLAAVKLGGDEKVLEVVIDGARERLAQIRRDARDR